MLIHGRCRMSTQSVQVSHEFFPVATMRHAYLMCPPRFYDVNYVINPWMTGNLHATSSARALEQWRSLYHALRGIADVMLLEPQSGLPDMVFTANAGLEHNGIVILSSFRHIERQPEENFFRRWFSSRGYTIIEFPREISFEGEGDALFSNDHSLLWAGYGMRTTKESHAFLSRSLNIEVVSLQLVDPRFYHLDTCFAPLADGYILYYPPAFGTASLARIEDYYPMAKRIPVSEEDACNFACNAINLDRTILLNNVSEKLRERLETAGFQMISLALDEFLKAGGAAKCLVMQLNHPAIPMGKT